MTLTFATMTVLFVVFIFVAILGWLGQFRKLALGGLIACICLMLIGIGFSTIGTQTVEITGSGTMQAVDGQYIYRSGKSNNHLHFYTLGEGENNNIVEDVYAELYEIRVSDERPYTYDEAVYMSRLLFLNYKSKHYIVYVPSGTERQTGGELCDK